jgi:hypothetical protein
MTETKSIQDRLQSYNPHVLFIGIRKDTGRFESVLCCDKKSIMEAVANFETYRSFFLKEQPVDFFIDKD